VTAPRVKNPRAWELKMASAAHAMETKKMGMQALATFGVALLLLVAAYCALFVAPNEATMGLIQRIFYFHVPFGWSAFVAFAISFVSSIAYLRSRAPKWDWLAVSSAEVGVPFVTVMLVTGPIWAHPVWGIWWTWDARLTSTFVLWVLYVCYLLLRTLIDEPERRAVVSAVFNIFAAFDIPLVYFSIWFFRTQHPQPVIGGGGSMDPRMLQVLLVSWMAFLCFAFLVCWSRFRLELLYREIEEGHAIESLVGSGAPAKASLPLGRRAR
jgi:heme exporter protein C